MSLLVMLRQLYLGRSTGTLSAAERPAFAHLIDGELFLSSEDPAAGEIVAGAEGAVRDLALSWRDYGKCRFDGGRARLPDNPVGPLKTLDVLISLAVEGLSYEDLRELLGGEGVRFQSRFETPALQQMRAFDHAKAQVLPRLESPSSLEDLARLSGLGVHEAAQALAALWAVGLAKKVEDPAPTSHEDLVTPRLLELFSDRIVEMLDRGGGPEMKPELSPEEHRAYVDELLQSSPRFDHFRFFGLTPSATASQISGAFSRVACLVHPRHAAQPELAGRVEALRQLFHHAVEAYLVLSEPVRRTRYIQTKGLMRHQKAQVSEAQRQRETKGLAAQYYRESLHYLSRDSMDYMSAVNILTEAVRLDPQPAYFARLAEAQAHNPQWRGRAAASYRRAIEGQDDNPDWHAALGGLLSQAKDARGACAAYQAALKLDPEHATAQMGLERLGVAGSVLAAGRRLRRFVAGEDPG